MEGRPPMASRDARWGVIVVAAGRGERMRAALRRGGTPRAAADARVPKAFLDLGGEPMVARALRALRPVRAAETVLVLAPDFLPVALRRWGRALRAAGATAVVPGGARRQDSVAAGLAALGPSVRWVLIHDAARPLVPPDVVAAAARAARRTGAAIVAVPCDDTLKRARADGTVERTIPRERVWRVQTPQVFRRDLLARAFARAGRRDVTDECALMEAIGVRVAIVPGAPCNLKVTTPGDLAIARALAGRPTRPARRR